LFRKPDLETAFDLFTSAPIPQHTFYL